MNNLVLDADDDSHRFVEPIETRRKRNVRGKVILYRIDSDRSVRKTEVQGKRKLFSVQAAEENDPVSDPDPSYTN